MSKSRPRVGDRKWLIPENHRTILFPTEDAVDGLIGVANCTCGAKCVNVPQQLTNHAFFSWPLPLQCQDAHTQASHFASHIYAAGMEGVSQY